MRLEEHIADTLKEWELKLGKIDGGIRLYYPCDSIREYLGQAYTVAQGEDLAECVRQYLQAEAAYLGPVKTEYHEGRIAVQIPEEGCQYVADGVSRTSGTAACVFKRGKLRENTKFV